MPVRASHTYTLAREGCPNGSSDPNNQDAGAPFNRRNSESSTMLVATRSWRTGFQHAER